MPSIFDAPRFNASLFFPAAEALRPVPGARDLLVAVGADTRLHLRIHDAADAVATVLLFHGNGEVVSDYDGAAVRFAAVGARLAVVDYRGYGASEGNPTLRDCLRDAHPVLAAVQAAVTPMPIVVMGRSLGGACAAELCQQPRPDVVGYVFESAPADLHGTLRRRGIVVEGALPEDDLAVFCPLRKLRRCETPALVLHGAADTLIVPSEARLTLGALGTTDKTLVTIPGCGHNNVSVHPVYWQALGQFVQRVAATTAP